ncbi:hypothetical protein ACFVUH_31430 [Kitasatospora sp. NPDC058032]|uniref:hypothetical protein n=1 Tax=Kitasatospora sp. NPDC058032 TaxID=3346307 RepID=UPI0036DB1C65
MTAALALADGHSGEIDHTRIRNLDPHGRRVWMHGSAKTDPRCRVASVHWAT